MDGQRDSGGDGGGEGRQRRVAAVLANAELRLVWARLVTGAGEDAAFEGLGASARRRARASLVGAGLAVEHAARGLAASAAPFERLLAERPVRRTTGPERFLRADGRIDRYPAQAAERGALLRLVADAAFDEDEELDERAVNERLERFADDVATLRRYLVDAGLLERTRSGTSYARVEELHDP